MLKEPGSTAGRTRVPASSTDRQAESSTSEGEHHAQPSHRNPRADRADVARPPAVGSCEPGESRFAPLLSRTVALTITTVEDELGRPLVGVFVPDGELL